MTNRSNLADGPPNKRRRTIHQNRKSPKSTTVPDSTPAELNTTPQRRDKKPAGSSRKKEPTEPLRGGRRDDAPPPTTDEKRCTDYMADEWRPNFRSTYPLAKALERRRVLVDYIHLVKRINTRKDKVEAPQKRPSVLQPQTIEDLEKEIEKCSQELDMLSHKRDENLETKKSLMAKYKALYREEDEERKKLQQQQEEQKAKAMAETDRLLALITSGVLSPEQIQQLLAATSNVQASGTAINSFLQSAQQAFLNSNPNIPTPSMDLLSQFNQLSAAQQLNAAQQQPKVTPSSNTNISHNIDSRTQPAVKYQITTTASSSRAPASLASASLAHQHSNLLNQPGSSAASLNLFHSLSSTQNPFSLTNQPTTGLLTQQSQGGLVSSQSHGAHNTDVRDQTPSLNTQHLLQASNQQQPQNRSSPNVQAPNLLQQVNPFLSASSSSTGSNALSSAVQQQQQQSRAQSAFPTASTQQAQLDLQNLFNQLTSAQSLQNFAAMLPGGMNNPNAGALLAAFQQQQQLNAAQQQLNAAQQAQQKQNLLLQHNLLNAASRQSPLASGSYSANQSQQQAQLGRKTGAVSLTNQGAQQTPIQNRLQVPGHQSIGSSNLAGRSATPQFAVPNLPVASSQAKMPPRAQSTRPPMNFAPSVITSAINNNPTSAINLTPQQQSFQSMFQANLNPSASGSSASSNTNTMQQQSSVSAQEAMLQQLAGMDQMTLMFLAQQAAAQQQLQK